jgi:aminobenzoyl-glutamate transport protein
MSYFPLILAFARRYDKSLGVGSLLALMLPYALSFMLVGLTMTMTWVTLDLPLGPGAEVFYTPPAGGLK